MDRREKFRKGLNRLYLPYYDSLCGVLDEKWQPFFGVRSIPDQDHLYAFGRTIPNSKILTRAKGGESPHNYGCASDWTVFSNGTPLWPAASDKIWQEYQQAIEKVGSRWGADWDGDGYLDEKGLIDCPHNELRIAGTWRQVDFVRLSDPSGVQAYLEKHLLK